MKNSLYLVPLMMVLCPFATADKCDVDSGFRGSYFNVGYAQRELWGVFRRLDYMPKKVRGRLEEYLQTKLGSEFAKKLKFEEGHWLDLHKLREQFPEKYEENADRGAYYLLFSYADAENGLKAFFSRLVLNEDGTVNVEIGLPDIGAHPEKASILSCERAYSIAEKNGFPPKECFAEFEYSAEIEAFVWRIHDTREVEPDDPQMPRFNGTYRIVEINANTGAVVRIFKHTIVL